MNKAEEISRREFIKRCFCAAVTAWGFIHLPFLNMIRKADAMGNKKIDFEPAYLNLHKTGELRKRGEELWAMMQNCRLCPRGCGVNRLEGKEAGLANAHLQGMK